MSLFTLKLILTPLLIAAATLTARRWGPAIGGLLTGLPLTSGPVSVFLALEQGPFFAAQAGRGTLVGLISLAAFCAVYARSAEKFAWPISLSAGLAVYAGATWGLSFLSANLGITILLVLLLIFAALTVSGRSVSNPKLAAAPWWDLPMRMVAATGMVLLITGGATLLGPKWSGLISPFPVFAGVMAVFAQRQAGAAPAQSLLRGVILGAFAAAAFFIVVELFVEHTNLILVYALAAVTALAVNGLSMIRVMRRI